MSGHLEEVVLSRLDVEGGLQRADVVLALVGKGLQEVAVGEPLGEYLEPRLRERVAHPVGPSVESHLEVAVGDNVATHVACTFVGGDGLAGLQVLAAVVVTSAEAAYVQTIAGALGVGIVGEGVVGLGVLRRDGLPCLPAAAGLFAQHLHELVVLAVVVVPGDGGRAAVGGHAEVTETTTHGRCVGHLGVVGVVAHAGELLGIPLSGAGQLTVDVELRLFGTFAVPVEVALYVAPAVELGTNGLHGPLVVPLVLAALEDTVMVPRCAPDPL